MATNPTRLAALRRELASRKLDAFIVPLTDEHMSEYVGDYAQRLAWLTGFEGSAGNAVILADKAAIFVDGRYTLQVKAEVDPSLIEAHHFEEYPLLKWLADNLTSGSSVGYDGELTTIEWEETATAQLAMKGISLTAVTSNPIDVVWDTQPPLPTAQASAHAVEFTGQSAEEKRRDIAHELNEKGADAAVITMLDSVAWAFNIRGEDVLNTPVTHAFAVLNADETATLFINPEKVTDELRAHLGNRVSLEPRDAFYPALKQLAAKESSVLVDWQTNNAEVFRSLKGATLIEGQDPCIIRKAQKNAIEQEGSRNAHVRDGAAVCDFLHWLSVEAPSGKLDEMIAADKLWACRSRHTELKGRSFDTISGAGPNGAIVHYRVNEKTNRAINNGELYLVDSGAQYFDGTTDITRTIAVGTPTDEMRRRFTLVLKGHIALSTTRFPRGTSGHALDAIARRPLWQAGLDYDHGTGHGVGSFLAVHEGPQRIAKFGSPIPLEEGMILSNEPGYYKNGEYGIRIENLVLVKPLDAHDASDNEERPMLGFENLTWAPIDKTLIDLSILSDEELNWLNTYHSEVWGKLNALVLPETRDWLQEVTSPLVR